MSLGGRDEPSLGVLVYGPDGTAYGSPAQARAAGVSNPTMSPPAGVPISYPGRQPYTSAPIPYIPTPSSGGRNRYAEIMAQFGQSQPFSLFGYPQTYTGGFTANPSTYTGGFTPYQRLVTPQPVLPVEGTTSATAGGGGGGSMREEPSAWSQMTPAEQAAYYKEHPIEGGLALAGQDALGWTTLGAISKYGGPDNWYNSRLIKQGLDPESFAYGPPDPNFSSQAAAAARNEALQGAIAAANANTGLVANPMSIDPSQRVVSTPVVTAPIVETPTIPEGLLSTPPAVSVNEAAQAQAEIQSLLNRYPALVAPPVPVVTAPIVETPAITEGLLSTSPVASVNEAAQAQAETQSLLNRYPALVAPPAPVVTAPVVAPVPAYVAPAPAPAPTPAPVQMVNITQRWNGEDSPDPSQGWTSTGGRNASWVRNVAVPASNFTNNDGDFDFGAFTRAGGSISGIGGGQGSTGGGYTVGGYAPGSQAGAAAASGQFGMGPGTPGFNSGGDGFSKGGHVSMMHLQGPNPMGPDDGYAALKDGEYVINDKAVKKYGIELMNLINSGKISKGKLRGLLEM